MAVQQFTETVSPFYDVDVLNFAMTIPLEHRCNQDIYRKWILKKYPKAATYVWEKTGEKINAPSIYVGGKEVTLKKLFAKMMTGLKLKKTGYSSKNNMNPLDYWLTENLSLNEYYHNYFKENIDRVENIQLNKDCKEHFNNGTGVEKAQVLTLLSALKSFFD